MAPTKQKTQKPKTETPAAEETPVDKTPETETDVTEGPTGPDGVATTTEPDEDLASHEEDPNPVHVEAPKPDAVVKHRMVVRQVNSIGLQNEIGHVLRKASGKLSVPIKERVLAIRDDEGAEVVEVAYEITAVVKSAS